MVDNSLSFLNTDLNVSNDKSLSSKTDVHGHEYCLVRRHLSHYLKRMFCVHNEPANVSYLFIHMRTQVNAHQSRWLSKSMILIMGLLVKRIVAYFGNYYLNLCLSCMSLNFYGGLCLHCSQISAKRAISMLIKHLADRSRPIEEEGMWEIVRASEGVECWREPLRGCDHWFSHDLDPGHSEAPRPLSLDLGMYALPTILTMFSRI